MAFTTPRTWTTGELVTAAMLNQQIKDNTNAEFPVGVDAWTTVTPTLTQSGAVTKTVDYARYMKVGRLCAFNFYLTVTGTGTAGNTVTVSLPFTAVQGNLHAIGAGVIFDTSAGFRYPGIAVLSSATAVGFFPASEKDQNGYLGGVIFGAALAAGDTVTGQVVFESTT